MLPEERYEANQSKMDAEASQWNEWAERRGMWRCAPDNPACVLNEKELHYLSDIAGKKIAVLGSEYDEISFALAGMDAKVTAIAISDRQHNIDTERAEDIGLDIRFIRTDVIDMKELKDGAFDFVYTGGHMSVWVADLERYYREAARMLSPEGILIANEYHPFRRIFSAGETLLVGNSYYNRGPYPGGYDIENSDDDAGRCEFHWTVSDLINAAINASCEIVEVYEEGDAHNTWEASPTEGIPERFMIVARKKISGHRIDTD